MRGYKNTLGRGDLRRGRCGGSGWSVDLDWAMRRIRTASRTAGFGKSAGGQRFRPPRANGLTRRRIERGNQKP